MKKSKKQQGFEQRGHQGDVQFKEAELPDTARKIEKRILAYGEHSGHCHVVTGDYDLFEEGGNTYVKTGNDGAFLQHVYEQNFGGNYAYNKELQKADHNPVKLKPNSTFIIGIHKQYDPFGRVWEAVQD